MINKTLLGGVIGFLLGGLVVSTAAVTLDKKEEKPAAIQTAATTVDHNQEVTEQLKGLTGDEFDKAFIDEMINHHQGAIDMANLTGSNAKHDEVKKLGQDIISAQTNEIEMMKKWQSEWGYSSGAQSHDLHGM